MSENRFRQVAEDYYVAPQLEAADFATARALGVRTVINNRPDGEAADQLSDAEARELAARAGLAYAFVPIVSGGIGPGAMSELVEVLDSNPGPFLAYCRPGTRSCYLWALQAARGHAPEEILKAAAAAGYDLAPARELLRQIHEANRPQGQ